MRAAFARVNPLAKLRKKLSRHQRTWYFSTDSRDGGGGNMEDSLLSGDLGNIVVPAVMDGIASTRGEAFFDAITQRMSLAVGADYLLIGRLQNGNTQARTIAVYDNNQRIENFVYDLKDTPCEQVKNCAGAKLYRSGIQQAFPEDQMLVDMQMEGYYGTILHSSDGEALGLIVSLYKTPVPDPERTASIFSLFAGRIAAEIESTEKKEALKALNRALEHRVAERTEALEVAKLRAEKADRAKSVFLACMSHEIRTPLNGVLGMAELLEGSELTEQQAEYLQALRQSGSALMSIVNDVLDYTRIFSGEIDFNPVAFDLEEWLHSVITPFYATLGESVKLELHIDPAAVGLYRGDKDRLQQVVTNLVNNAIKFTPSGKIEVRVEVADEHGDHRKVRFCVTDSGIGIAPHDQQRIFEPFMQADSTTTRKYGGTGLGLSISKNIVTSMGGTIDVESFIDKGSRFHFVVPLQAEREIRTATEPSPRDNQYPGVRVLLVEDNPVNQFLTVTQLEELGMHAEVAHDGREAVERVCEKQERYDLVLMDCEMPGMDGFEATRTIRAWEEVQGFPKIPIYALTAHVLAENSDACAEVGMDGRLTKPIKIADYYPVLDKVAGRPGA